MDFQCATSKTTKRNAPQILIPAADAYAYTYVCMFKMCPGRLHLGISPSHLILYLVLSTVNVESPVFCPDNGSQFMPSLLGRFFFFSLHLLSSARGWCHGQCLSPPLSFLCSSSFLPPPLFFSNLSIHFTLHARFQLSRLSFLISTAFSLSLSTSFPILSQPRCAFKAPFVRYGFQLVLQASHVPRCLGSRGHGSCLG